MRFIASPDVQSADVIGIPVFEGRSLPAGLPEGAGVDLGFLEARGFEGKVGDSCALPGGGGRTVVAVGAGDPAKVDGDNIRCMAATLVRAAWKSASVAFVPPVTTRVEMAAASEAAVVGAMLASYRFTVYKSDPKPCAIEAFTVAGGDPAAVERGSVVGRAVRFARDLVNEPAGAMTPTRFAETAQRIAEDTGLAIRIWEEDDITRERLGGLIGVSRGSDQPPRLVQLEHAPANARGTVVLVGKGITFDSGGLSLKTADGMTTMKTDMSGAAAVLGAMSALPALGLPVRVVGITPLTENMPGGRAIKPGDVLRFRNGKTAEILNTDAEGRLVLADALSLAAEMEPDAIVDLATLTGACVVALGREIGGLMGTSEPLVEQLLAASKRAGEPLWHLPLPDRYRKHIDSEIADIKNTGATGQAGTLSAGLFLREFVGDVPWAHLDIAGPARAENEDGYITKGGTGFGVRTLLELLQSFEAPSS